MLSSAWQMVLKRVLFRKSADTGTVEIVFREYEHDFGKVHEGEKVGYVFTFENTRELQILLLPQQQQAADVLFLNMIQNQYLPGEEGNLEVVFDTSGRNGMQTKTITVKSNASTPVVLIKNNC